MITLGPTDGVAAGAISASVVNYVVEGEVVSTAPDATPAFKVLASGQLGVTVAQLYGPGPGNQALISRIAFFNTSGAAVLVTVAESGITTATMSIPANGFSEYEPQSGWTVYSNLGVPVAGGGGGGGGVTSVNTRSGAVVLKASDITGGVNGTANQLLATDGSGNGSWVNAPSGSAAIDATKFGVLTTNADNTAALISLINSSVAAAQANGTNFVELYFPPGKYNFTSAPTQGGPTKGNAQIPLPIIATGVQKVTLVFRSSVGGGDTLPYWQQTVGQKSSGAVFYTNWNGAYSSTFGPSSVLGGPTSEQGYGNSTDSTFLFSNMHVVIDGISVVNSTVNPTMCGFDFTGVAEMTVGSAGAFVDAATNTVATTFPTHAWCFGLHPPNQGNNDICNIRSWSCEGYFIGLVVTEHCVVTSLRCVYCNVGITGQSQEYAHGSIILYASVESCGYYLTWSNYMHIIVVTLDIEHNHGSVFDGGFDISDGGSNNARGYVGFQVSGSGEGEGTEPIVNGCSDLKIINVGRRAAIFNIADASPLINIPASGTALLNPFWRDAMVYVEGGTVTVITVTCGGQSRAIGATSGAVMVPSGASIAITYSVAPTWVWTIQ